MFWIVVSYFACAVVGAFSAAAMMSRGSQWRYVTTREIAMTAALAAVVGVLWPAWLLFWIVVYVKVGREPRFPTGGRMKTRGPCRQTAK